MVVLASCGKARFEHGRNAPTIHGGQRDIRGMAGAGEGFPPAGMVRTRAPHHGNRAWCVQAARRLAAVPPELLRAYRRATRCDGSVIRRVVGPARTQHLRGTASVGRRTRGAVRRV